MALLLNEIQWGEPLLPLVADPAWEAEVASRGGRPNTVDLRTAPLPWLREFCFSARTYFYSVAVMPERLFPMVAMVVAQENSCRYCYGLNRALLKILGIQRRSSTALSATCVWPSSTRRSTPFSPFAATWRDRGRARHAPKLKH